MLTIETKSENVMILRLSGILTIDDIAAMKKAVFDRLADGEPIGLVVDVCDWDDMTAEAIAADAKFEWEMLGKLRQIPRVAFIANKQWYNALIGLLKSLLPLVEVKTFSPDLPNAMQQATEFASAAASQSIAEVARPSIERIPTDRDDLLAFEYRGYLKSEDLKVVLEPVKAAMDRHQKIDLFVRLDHFTGFDPSIIFHRLLLSVKMAAMTTIRRYAIVGANSWMKRVVQIFDPLVSIEMRTFDIEQEAEAWEWLNSKSQRVS